jgi:hypothetical protein
MANYRIIHERISKGRGKAALRVGQIFEVKRLTSRGFVQISPNLNCIIRRIHGGKDVEQKLFVSQVFELTCDVRKFMVGDLFFEKESTQYSQKSKTFNVEDNLGEVGVIKQSFQPCYILVSARPVHKFIGIRLETQCQVRRGIVPPNDINNYQEAGQNSEAVFTLSQGKGSFSLIPTTTEEVKPTLIPMQLEPAMIRSQPHFNLPMDYLMNKWHFACPVNWDGLILKENDYFIDPFGNRYRVIVVFASFLGMMIQQGILEKMES